MFVQLHSLGLALLAGWLMTFNPLGQQALCHPVGVSLPTLPREMPAA